MQDKNYRGAIMAAVNELLYAESNLSHVMFGVAITGEWKEWNATIKIGEKFYFDKEIFEGCSDMNLQLLTKLLNETESTVDSICNLNNIKITR